MIIAMLLMGLIHYYLKRPYYTINNKEASNNEVVGEFFLEIRIFKNEKVNLTFLSFVASIISLFLTLAVAVYSNALVLWSEFYSYCIDVVVLGLSFGITYINQRKAATFEFGLGKIESSTGILLAFLMFVYGAIIIFSVSDRIMNPEPVTNVGYGTFLYIIFTIKDSFLFVKLRVFEKVNDSAIISSQKNYYLMCIMTDLVVLLPLIFVYFMDTNNSASMAIDILASLAICFITIYLSFGASKKAACDLLDKALEESHQLLILKALAKHYDLYREYHGQRTRQSGGVKYIDIFLGFEGDETWGEVVDKIEVIQKDIKNYIPGSEVFIIPSTDKQESSN